MRNKLLINKETGNNEIHNFFKMETAIILSDLYQAIYLNLVEAGRHTSKIDLLIFGEK